MILGAGVIDGDATGLFLFLFLGIVGGEIGGDSLPGFPAIARTEQKLAADINGVRLIGTDQRGRVPVEPVFWLAGFGVRRDGLQLAGALIKPQQFSVLPFRIYDVLVARIREGVKAIAEANIAPIAALYAAGPLTRSHPRAVILQAAKDVVGLIEVIGYVIELAYRKRAQERPIAAVVGGFVNTAIGTVVHSGGLDGINPQRVVIGMHSPRPHRAKALAAIFAHGEIEPGLVDAVVILGIDNQQAEVERAHAHD